MGEDAPRRKKSAPASSPSSLSAAKEKPHSSPSGPPNLPRKTGPAATPPLRGRSISQGTREKCAASSDLFLKEALTFFGDEETANAPTTPSEKGKRLADLVGQRRSLLILDGLEPLQYAPTSTAFPPGQLKDEAIAKLLKDLAAASHGLCVVTTRYSMPDLKAFWQTTAAEKPLCGCRRKPACFCSNNSA